MSESRKYWFVDFDALGTESATLHASRADAAWEVFCKIDDCLKYQLDRETEAAKNIVERVLEKAGRRIAQVSVDDTE